MQALFWDGQHLRLDMAYPTPPADATTAVAHVHLAGICATDWQIVHGYMGFRGVPGHEFVGEVSAGPAELVVTRNEITVVGSRCGRFPRALQALAHGHVTVAPLIERSYPLGEGMQVLAHAT